MAAVLNYVRRICCCCFGRKKDRIKTESIVEAKDDEERDAATASGRAALQREMDGARLGTCKPGEAHIAFSVKPSEVPSSRPGVHDSDRESLLKDNSSAEPSSDARWARSKERLNAARANVSVGKPVTTSSRIQLPSISSSRNPASASGTPNKTISNNKTSRAAGSKMDDIFANLV